MYLFMVCTCKRVFTVFVFVCEAWVCRKETYNPCLKKKDIAQKIMFESTFHLHTSCVSGRFALLYNKYDV